MRGVLPLLIAGWEAVAFGGCLALHTSAHFLALTFHSVPHLPPHATHRQTQAKAPRTARGRKLAVFDVGRMDIGFNCGVLGLSSKIDSSFVKVLRPRFWGGKQSL